ncbi:MAG: 23S rRNA (adenine(2030)-N(6))-methyltransferase RlmJ [Rhodospirillales bacterium]|nr:23S rRNA (adenine(2030)-N(6))-methyltransferase RlmJ [Rhodospirillales bacterium]
MNYRHAYHAGNFGDCLKQALLMWLVERLQRKERPIAVFDTHAGAGAYDFGSTEGMRIGEWKEGIGRLLSDPPVALAAYVALVQEIMQDAEGAFPGTPLLVRRLLRPGDRLVCCELHPEEYASLKRRFAGDRQVAVHHRDGWEALKAILPLEPRRGLVLIDPPYEEPGEFARLAAGLGAAQQRFPTGVLAAWYPIKHRAPVRDFHEALAAGRLKDVVTAELYLREPTDPARLNGAGLLVARPPYEFAPAARAILDALSERLGQGEPGGGAALLRITGG